MVVQRGKECLCLCTDELVNVTVPVKVSLSRHCPAARGILGNVHCPRVPGRYVRNTSSSSCDDQLEHFMSACFSLPGLALI